MVLQLNSPTAQSKPTYPVLYWKLAETEYVSTLYSIYLYENTELVNIFSGYLTLILMSGRCLVGPNDGERYSLLTEILKLKLNIEEKPIYGQTPTRVKQVHYNQ